jgi:integrase
MEAKIMDSSKLLSLDEINTVLAWLHHRRRRGRNYRLNCAIFRLACCCGLQASELCALELGQVRVCGAPALYVEGRRPRVISIWDRGTLIDLAVYKQLRGLGDDAPFLVGPSTGKGLTPDLAAKRWRSLMRVTLGMERAKQLSIQSGRRSYASFAAAHGRTLDEVSRALGTRPATARKYLRMAG